MTAGRRPLPEWAKKLKGTLRKNRQNPQAPDPVKKKPSPPRWLPPKEKKIFRQLVKKVDEQGYASKSHEEMLTLAALRLAEVERFTETLDEKGYTYEATGSTGQKILKERPERVMRAEAAKHAQALLAEFGLSPSSMGKVKAPGKKQPKSEWEGFGG